MVFNEMRFNIKLSAKDEGNLEILSISTFIGGSRFDITVAICEQILHREVRVEISQLHTCTCTSNSPCPFRNFLYLFVLFFKKIEHF